MGRPIGFHSNPAQHPHRSNRSTPAIDPLLVLISDAYPLCNDSLASALVSPPTQALASNLSPLARDSAPLPHHHRPDPLLDPPPSSPSTNVTLFSHLLCQPLLSLPRRSLPSPTTTSTLHSNRLKVVSPSPTMPPPSPPSGHTTPAWLCAVSLP